MLLGCLWGGNFNGFLGGIIMKNQVRRHALAAGINFFIDNYSPPMPVLRFKQ
jgi:hypothetical protein